eukprot:7923674-Pyramimonas_sp.AAC.1
MFRAGSGCRVFESQLVGLRVTNRFPKKYWGLSDLGVLARRSTGIGNGGGNHSGNGCGSGRGSGSGSGCGSGSSSGSSGSS